MGGSVAQLPHLPFCSPSSPGFCHPALHLLSNVSPGMVGQGGGASFIPSHPASTFANLLSIFSGLLPPCSPSSLKCLDGEKKHSNVVKHPLSLHIPTTCSDPSMHALHHNKSAWLLNRSQAGGRSGGVALVCVLEFSAPMGHGCGGYGCGGGALCITIAWVHIGCWGGEVHSHISLGA